MDELGYVLFPNVFSAEEMAELDETLSAYEARMRAQLIEAGGTSSISRADEITFNSHIAEQDDAVRAFVKRPEFVAFCNAFLGTDADLYWNQTVYKHPEGERIFPWHQDDAYTPVTPAPYLTLWLAINDATPENGCVSVLPGSHRDGLRPHEQSAIGLVGYPADAEDQGVLVPASAGSVVAFWSLTLHKSGANRSKGIRKAYVIQYASAGLRRVEDNGLIEGMIPVTRNGEVA
jgi:ectoine hydroxylase-related dioxygenase (phytanoyl-CoA dioxygenase family)